MTERILSPDGTQFWDGDTWQPVEADTSTPTAGNQPAAGSPQSGPSAYGGQQNLPAPAAAPADPAAGPGNSWEVNKWAWRVALSALIWGGVVWWLIDNDAPDWAYGAAGIVLLIGATFATDRDVRTLKQHGVEAEQAFTAAVLLLYVIGAPAYLIHRTRKARTTPLIPLTWFAGAMLAVTPFLLGGFSDTPGLFGSTEDVNVPGIESSLEDGLKDYGVRGATVDCPDDESYAEGDMVMCDATAPNEGDFEIVLDMRNDGYFEWSAQ